MVGRVRGKSQIRSVESEDSPDSCPDSVGRVRILDVNPRYWSEESVGIKMSLFGDLPSPMAILAVTLEKRSDSTDRIFGLCRPSTRTLPTEIRTLPTVHTDSADHPVLSLCLWIRFNRSESSALEGLWFFLPKRVRNSISAISVRY